MVNYLVEGRGFGGASPVVLERLLCFLPRVAPEHAGWFGEVRLVGVLELGRIADRDSGQASIAAPANQRHTRVQPGARPRLATGTHLAAVTGRATERLSRPPPDKGLAALSLSLFSRLSGLYWLNV